jgi:hypothetical protein
VTAIRSVRAAEGKFVQISNAALQDKRLSWSARGILAFVLSLPPDQHLTAKWLESQAPNGREAVRSALQELERFGYYLRTRRPGIGGHWEWEQVISDARLTEESSQVAPCDGKPSDGYPSDGYPSDGKPSDKRPNTEDPKDVGPIDMASRRARAKAASMPWTVNNVIAAVRRAVAIEFDATVANDLTDGEALGLFFTYVGARRPRDVVAYLGKIFADAPYLDTFLANSEAACLRCQKWESDCGCPAA